MYRDLHCTINVTIYTIPKFRYKVVIDIQGILWCNYQTSLVPNFIIT